MGVEQLILAARRPKPLADRVGDVLCACSPYVNPGAAPAARSKQPSANWRWKPILDAYDEAGVDVGWRNPSRRGCV
jgi:hypothetical protein